MTYASHSGFHSRSRGITLIEVLVAVTIFAVLGIMSYRAVSQAADSRTRLETEFTDWQDVSRALGRVETDLQQLGARYGGNASGLQSQSPLLFKLQPDGSSRMTFWRLDVAQGARLTGFEFVDGAFDLLRWPSADTTQPPHREHLLTGVGGVSWAFVGKASPKWMNSWPPTPAQAGEVPLGISLQLDVEKFGKISRVFAIN